MSLVLWDDDDDEDYAYPEQDEMPLDLGPCCACGKEDETVRNIGMLDFVAPVPGTGWGCVVCDIPDDGALVVVCDECAQTNAPYKWLISGQAGEKKRIPFAGFTQMPYGHDMTKHPEVQPFRNAHGVMAPKFDVVEELPFFRMPTDYVPPHNTPLYWRDEVTGVLPQAVMAYIGHIIASPADQTAGAVGGGNAEPETKPAPTAEQLALVIAYLRYVINAPCWIDETGALTRLRAQAASLTTVDDVNWWLVDCLEIGLDPL